MGVQVAQLVVIPSVWGHMGMNLRSFTPIWDSQRRTAGGGSNDQDDQFIFQRVQEFLES